MQTKLTEYTWRVGYALLAAWSYCSLAAPSVDATLSSTMWIFSSLIFLGECSLMNWWIPDYASCLSIFSVKLLWYIKIGFCNAYVFLVSTVVVNESFFYGRGGCLPGGYPLATS